MAHWSNSNAKNPFSWAGQAADDPFSQQWLPNRDPSAQPVGPAGLLSTDAPRNDESLIKDFNDELPDHEMQENFLGQSSWLLVNGAPADHRDLPFDLAIDNGIDLDAAKPVSYGLARTSSQASSTGIDEESVSFSNADDLYDTGFDVGYGDGTFNDINSPGTSFSDVILSTNPSLENSPVAPRCPFLSIHKGNFIPGPSRTAPSAPQSSIVNVERNFSGVGPASSSTPRGVSRQNVSALSTGLANQSLYEASPGSASEYFEQWSSRAGDDVLESLDVGMWDESSLSEGFVPYTQSQLGPSFVIDPPETSDVTMGELDDCTTSEFLTSPEIHPIDYYLSASYAPAQLTEPRSVPNVAIPSASATNPTNRLLVPSRRRRRKSDPVSMNAAFRDQPSASSPQPIMNGSGIVSLRGNSSQNTRARFSSPVGSPRFQRLRPSEPPRSSAVTPPMPIASRPRRLSATSTSPDSRAMTARPGRPGPVRGRRHGPMDPISRGQAKETRNRKMVCIRCKHSKQKCKRSDDSFDGSCIGCEKHGGSQRWPGPCVKAHFEDLVLSGSCNYLSQRAIYHPTLDGARLIRRELPRQIRVDELLERLDRARRRFNFKAYQDGQPIYVLDLDSCYEYLLSLKQQMDGREYSFQTFIDRELLRTDPRNDDWERCMTQTMTPGGDWLSLLCDINKMSSHASFSYVSKPYYTAPGTAVERVIDAEDPNEADNFILATQLSRIICRKLELKAYQHLQRLLHESGTMDDDGILPFLRSLGRIVLTLRWGLSWRAVVPEDLAMSDHNDAADLRQVESRVHSLCRVLYFYYCCVRRRLPVWTNVDALRGVHSKYPGAKVEIWDDFPGNESVEEFEAWIGRGRQLIVGAGVLDRLKPMGITA